MFQAKNIELARLATWFSLTQPGIDTHVCGLYTMEQLKDTLDVLATGLTEQERNVLEDIQLRYELIYDYSNGIVGVNLPETLQRVRTSTNICKLSQIDEGNV